MRGPMAITFLTFVAFAIVYPALPFQALELGATAPMVTALLVVEPFTAAVVAPLAGGLSDRRGRRPVMLVLLGMAVPAYLLLAFADSLLVLFVSRLLAGVSTAVSPIIQAYLADTTSSEDRTPGMASVNAAYCLAFIVGPLIAAVTLGDEGRNFLATALVAAGTALLATVLAACWLDASRAVKTESKAPSGRHQGLLALTAIPRAGCLSPVTVLVILGLAYAAMDTTLGLWLDRVAGWGPRELSYAFATAGTAALLALCVIRKFIASLGEVGTAAACALAMGLGFAALLSNAGWFGLLPAMMLLGAGMAVGTSCLQGLISKAAPEDSQGLVLGQSDALFSAANILGPLAAGLVITRFGIAWPYIICSVLAVATVPLLIHGRHARGLVPPRTSHAE